MLTRKLARALARQGGSARVGVMIVELQHYDRLCALHGPDAADRVVRRLADRLAESAGPGRTVGRTGTHDFAVIVEEIGSPDELLAAARDLRRALQMAVRLGTATHIVTVRIGSALAEAGETDAARLLTDPLVALHHPEIPSSAMVRSYDSGLRERLAARARISSELCRAVEKDEIEPYYQPQIRLSDGSVSGVEVLARWRHPERGLIAPGLFLGIAEDAGLLPAIDDVIMRKAIGQLAGWERAGLPPVRVSLNASGEALRDRSYPDHLCFQLDRYELSSDSVSIEILESVLIEAEDDVASRTIDTLKRRGFKLELDDFGSGHASIATLIALKVDTVKLDRALIRGICTDRDSYKVVRSILGLASQLGVRSLAEGVEDAEQLRVLGALGCQFGQGFGIARPMSAADATAWLFARTRPGRAALPAAG